MHKKSQVVVIVLVALSIALSFIVHPPHGLSAAGLKAIAVLLCAIILWISNVIHPALTGLTMMVIMPLMGIISFDKVVGTFGIPMLWLLNGISFISLAVGETGLDRRFALSVLCNARGNVYLVVLFLLLITFVTAFIIPSSVGRTSILMPICVGLSKVMELKPGSNIGRMMFIGVALASILSSTALITGGASSIITAQLFQNILNYHWSFTGWMFYFMPISVFMLIYSYFMLIKVFPPEISFSNESQLYIINELNNMGKWNVAEKKVFFIVTLMILMLLTSDLHKLPIALIFLSAGILLCMPITGVLNWNMTLKRADWNTFILFGSSLSISESLEKTGVFDFFTKKALSMYNGLPVFALILIVILFCIIIRIMFSNMTGMTATIMPIMISISQVFHLNPVTLGVIALLSSNYSMFLPTQSPNFMITYGSGFYTVQDTVKTGILFVLGFLLIIGVVIFFYWPIWGIRLISD